MLKTYQFKTHCKVDSHSSKTANIILWGLMIKQRWTSLCLQVKYSRLRLFNLGEMSCFNQHNAQFNEFEYHFACSRQLWKPHDHVCWGVRWYNEQQNADAAWRQLKRLEHSTSLGTGERIQWDTGVPSHWAYTWHVQVRQANEAPCEEAETGRGQTSTCRWPHEPPHSACLSWPWAQPRKLCYSNRRGTSRMRERVSQQSPCWLNAGKRQSWRRWWKPVALTLEACFSRLRSDEMTTPSTRTCWLAKTVSALRRRQGNLPSHCHLSTVSKILERLALTRLRRHLHGLQSFPASSLLIATGTQLRRRLARPKQCVRSSGQQTWYFILCLADREAIFGADPFGRSCMVSYCCSLLTLSLKCTILIDL